VLAGVARAARNGILIKGGAHLESLGAIRCFAMDKTGTLTVGRPTLRRIAAFPGSTDEEVLRMAASLEDHSTHPLANAVTGAKSSNGRYGSFAYSPALTKCEVVILSSV
jgi:Cd2+/Zn2+-exporting ATPase